MHVMNQEQSNENAGSAKRKRGRPKGSRTKNHPVQDLVKTQVCVRANCDLTADSAKRVEGAPIRYTAYNSPPHNVIKKIKVQCECGQIYYQLIAVHEKDPKSRLEWPQSK